MRLSIPRRFAALLRCATPALIAACASTGTTVRKRDARITFRTNAVRYEYPTDASVDAVWQVLPAAFQQLGFTGEPLLNAREHLYKSPRFQVTGRLYDDARNSAYFRCGALASESSPEDAFPLWFVMFVHVEARAAGSLVTIIVDGTATDPAHPSSSAYCSGTGKLEQSLDTIINTLVVRAAGGAPH